MSRLFFPDSLIDIPRAFAEERMARNPLIASCGEGNLEAARLLHLGFWPFVENFEKEIDRHNVPLEPLYQRFGRPETREIIVSMGRHLKQMAMEERSHAQLWYEAALGLGVELKAAVFATPTIQALMDATKTREEVNYYLFLAGTELIAESVSAVLTARPPYTDLFPEKRWLWGDVHLATHDGPSHLQMDIDWARAYLDESVDTENVKNLVESLLHAWVSCYDATMHDIFAHRKPLLGQLAFPAREKTAADFVHASC